MYCPTSCPKTTCFSACVKCKCCGKKQKVKFDVPIPNCAVAMSATLSGTNQDFSTTATTVLFNGVTLNETCYNPCYRCRCDPCCCSSSSSSSCGSKCGCSNHHHGHHHGGYCPPYPCTPSYQWWSQFYNATTGLATVPPEGGGQYVIVAGLETNSANTVTAEIQVNNVAIATVTFGGTPGNLITAFSAFRCLSPGDVIRVVVTDDTGAAQLIAGANTRLDIVRIKY